MEHEIEGLEEAIAVMKERQGKVAEEADEEERLLRENIQINESLHSKLAATEQQEKPAKREGDAIDEKAEKEVRRHDELEEKNARLKTCFLSFMSKYYPRPTQTSEETGEEMKSLREIVQTLMNKAVGSDDRFMKVTDDSIWPPFVELLIRSGIAEKHPTDSSLIRLSDLS